MSKVNWKPVFAIIPRRSQASSSKEYWMRIGTAFENSDGSWNIEFAALPRDGRCQIRNQESKFANSKPHALDPVEADPFESLPLSPVMQ